MAGGQAITPDELRSQHGYVIVITQFLRICQQDKTQKQGQSLRFVEIISLKNDPKN